MLIFETPHLRLRPLDVDDQALYCELYTDPGLMRHIGAPMTVEEARRSFQAACRLATRAGAAAQRWALSVTGLPEAIGLLGLIRDQDSAEEAEIGLMLRADQQRRGVAVAAIGAVADRLFNPGKADRHGLRLLRTRHSPDNVAALRLMLRMGFLRQPLLGPGQTEVHWSMSRDRWMAGRPGEENGKA